ncbi:TetR family transcriptional regulator [Burkholderia cenocepacia]|uniref:TetR/AcrR family transcriptional regulator n=2 Tax=Burkholderia cenocepacia TaxID=95486 RepID=UPI001B91E2EC|nr:TetR/AcrR family transcriptional regulator [Burkholderia cenocepacia]MBR8024048.1 TetR family transcriptional regulator [Burkholderia cenocepacia]MBR8169494.1 TetR family transcriptional regulator [Burkholderia cenocepacia]MBR8424175.1 TetR family transcriptional regulator [Burkholderia cenocepacia]MBU9658163.1 TetR/AcrR family transcriptional regulator [Burkholderia cenocepacia]
MARITKVLEAAERMLEEVGPEKTSIPALAETTGVPRAAIYPFFPEKYALFSHLAMKHMDGLAQALTLSGDRRTRDWREWVDAAIKVAADYYNTHPAASILLLRGSFSDTDRAAHESKNVSLGTLFRAKAASLGALAALPAAPDAATIAIEIAFACMKHGYATEGRVSPEICREATRAVISYLGAWDEQG